MSTAIASNNEASTPTACSSSQLRTIWANDGDEHERDHAAAAAQAAQHGEPRHSARPLRSARWRSPDPASAMAGDADQRHPPRQAERADERERRERGERRLDGEDRHLGRDERRHLRATSGEERRSAAIRAATPSCAVDHAAEHLHARRAVEDAPVDRPAGGPDRPVPGLGAREQRDHLEQHGRHEHGGATPASAVANS